MHSVVMLRRPFKGSRKKISRKAKKGPSKEIIVSFDGTVSPVIRLGGAAKISDLNKLVKGMKNYSVCHLEVDGGVLEFRKVQASDVMQVERLTSRHGKELLTKTQVLEYVKPKRRTIADISTITVDVETPPADAGEAMDWETSLAREALKFSKLTLNRISDKVTTLESQVRKTLIKLERIE